MGLTGAGGLPHTRGKMRARPVPVQHPFAVGREAFRARDYAGALRLWLPLARTGSASAQYAMGMLYHRGLGLPQDYEQAARYFLQAAHQGHVPAQLMAGLLCAEGHGVPSDWDRALVWLRRAARQDHPAAMTRLAVLYSGGHGAAQNFAEAAQWLERAARLDDPEAQWLLATVYEHGRGVAKDLEQACRWAWTAHANGHTQAGALLEELRASLSERQMDLGRAEALGLRALTKGHRLALQALRAGRRKTAAWLWKRLSARGRPEAEYHLARLLLEGRGLPRDPEQALVLLRTASRAGLPQAWNSLGRMYEKGLGTPRDLEQAVVWYRKAAEEGLADAQYNLSRLLARVSASESMRAVEWLRVSAEQDYVPAQYALAVRYARGRGVTRDAEQALWWASLAVVGGHRGACALWDRLGARVDPDMLESVRRRTRRWLLTP